MVIPFSSNATVGKLLTNEVTDGVNFGMIFASDNSSIDYFVVTSGSLFVFYGRMIINGEITRLRQITAVSAL